MPDADYLVLNGKIYTVDPAFSVCEAMVVKDGKIAWVGSNDQVKKFAGDGTVSYDLKGCTVVPGLVESHLHFLPFGKRLLQVDCFEKTKREILAEVKRRYSVIKPGEWIVGQGWNELGWEEKALPSREELDSVAPGVPVCLVRVCGHISWVNSKALETVGITRETAEPVGGEIHRNASGEPTGILVDTAAHPVRSLIPEFTDEQRKSAYLAAQKELFSYGFTSIHDMAGNIGYDYQTIVFLKRLYDEESLKICVCAYVAAPSAREAYEVGPEVGLFGNRLSVRGIKFFADGSLGARSAWLKRDYEDRRGHSGNPRFSDDELYRMVREARLNGFQASTHAIGDAANKQILDVYERVLSEIPEAKDHRFRVEHSQILDPKDFHCFTRLGVIPSMQFVHCTSDKDMTEKRVGAERLKGAFPWRTLIDRGSYIPGGSDAPVELINPFYGMYAGITRKDRNGQPENGWRPEEAVTREEALKSFTIWGARAGFEEHVRGSLEVGKRADFAVLTRDILTCPEDEVKDTAVKATIAAGELVYGVL